MGKKEQYKKLNRHYEGIDFEKRPFGYSWRHFSWNRDPMYKKVAEHLIEGNVLDDGGGFGYFRKFVPNRRYYNLDISPEILKYDKGENKVLGSGEDLPFDDESFDNVVSIGVLRQVIDEKAYLDEAYRVLKPGGRFIITTPRKEWLKDLLKSWFFWSVLIYYFKWVFCQDVKRAISEFKKTVRKDNKGIQSVPLPSRLFGEEWLRKELEERRFRIIHQTRCTKQLPGPIAQSFCEKFVDAKKYGQFSLFVCEKQQK